MSTAPPSAGGEGQSATGGPGPSVAPTAGPAPAKLKDLIPKLEPRRRKAEPANPTPVPTTPAAPPLPDPSTLSFRVPIRRILTPKDHELFLASPTYNLILSFIFGLSESVAGRPVSSVKDSDLSPAVRAILAILDETDSLCRESPPGDQGGSRFGNKAFRVFVDKVKQRAASWHKTPLPDDDESGNSKTPLQGPGLGIKSEEAAAELSTYLTHSFGNRQRIDYGSGHELNFAMWLLCLHRLSVLRTSDFPAVVLRVFLRYLEVMRRVQMTYYLEPAGSHGVWGLDDYQFLPFLFGASQLLQHPFLTPRAIHQELALEESGSDYMYLGQVAFVNSTKTVKGLRWHSPMLDDISSAKGWDKVEGGMRRMFVSEILKKLPVMQHFLFGSLIPAAEGMSEAHPAAADDEENAEGGDVQVFDDAEGTRHVHNQAVGWGDCCGIKVPSSLAAAAEEMKNQRGAGQQLRRIPFD